jgi:hypothetical protein
MQDYKIDVGKIEELQKIRDLQELDAIFVKAKSTLVSGAMVELGRKSADGRFTRFDKLTTLADLADYHKQVYKYLVADQ